VTGVRFLSVPALLLVSVCAFAESATVCGRPVDVPVPAIAISPPSHSVPLRRVLQLLRSFSEGDGTFVASDSAKPIAIADGVESDALPWSIDAARSDHVRLVAWHDADRGNDENMPAIVLHPGESWCTSEIDLSGNERLRFEAVSIGSSEETTLDVALDGARSIASTRIGRPVDLKASRQADLPLDSGRHSICFRARSGTLALGEPRVLAPEKAGTDERPRWLVLTIVDALRGDLLRGDDARTLLPALSHLAGTGRQYEKAIAPGCHTRASVWPILMGRDLMRIDPLQRRQSMPIQSPLEAIYSRANLFVGDLAESAGYHAVFLGNNAYLRSIPAFARYSSWGKTDLGTFDTIAELPELFARYGDERILLVYYVSTPHRQSETPRRLYDALGCAKLTGIDQCRCAYDARARHADEAIEALQEGLHAYGLDGNDVQIVTADHGELFEDGMNLEGEIPSFATGERHGAYASFELGHGNACSEKETDVPLVVAGKGIVPGKPSAPVSGLDILPTLLEEMHLPPPGRLDGRSLLGTDASRPEGARAFVSYGFCSDSRLQGDEQLVWWVEGCRIREPDGSPLDHRAEIWSEGRRVATEKDAPERLRHLMSRHEDWLRERLPGDAFVFGASGMEDADIVVRVEEGRIVDYGPSSSVYGLDEVALSKVAEDGSALSVRFHGYHGLYYVSTLPERARVRIEVAGRPDILTFVGAMQLPLPVAGVSIDPSRDETFLLAERPPPPRDSTLPSVRLWWEPFRTSDDGATTRQLTDFDRVLREWGYIR
jgi:Sulfatase